MSDDIDSKALEGPHPSERPETSRRRNPQGIRIDPDAEAEPDTRQVVLSALVAHEPGVLANVASLFSRRQFNIESLTVGATTDENRARITLVIEEPDPGIEQAKKQLQKLVPVVSVTELPADATRRDLALIKVDGTHPDQVQSLAEMYGGQAVDAGQETVTVEITGSEQKIDAAIDAFERFGIVEIVRTGTAALTRGAERTAPNGPQIAEPESKEVPADD
ncbi:acetolactate synthase small subunit [Natranaeroarchaeum sulfidigenes]|uniref:Acetolactate synthase, small subunit n=1 Tax=Natranaeroarchaeum sulfidigenes TaxID=2784880 RepID=A0A897MNU3_9EURY|nr:acetolactate synthase small subunit [Natranaeroarchaeum sulfidigenes]QSG02062.1 Acetolactate synthase, small subunit [Natranaeroarchaeum sulfidigenes]